jgi:hypothetical protein
MDLCLLIHRLNLYHIVHHKLTCRWVTAIAEMIWELWLISANRYILQQIQLEWRLHRIWFYHHLLRLACFHSASPIYSRVEESLANTLATSTNRSDINKCSDTELTIEDTEHTVNGMILFSHNTCDCNVFHWQLQSAIDESRLKFRDQVDTRGHTSHSQILPKGVINFEGKKILVQPPQVETTKVKNVI